MDRLSPLTWLAILFLIAFVFWGLPFFFEESGKLSRKALTALKITLLVILGSLVVHMVLTGVERR
jgi:hypothetical protein